MPRKVCDLKADLRRAGFRERPGKGSHTVWWHPLITTTLSVSGSDGSDAFPYQEKAVQAITREAHEAERKKP